MAEISDLPDEILLIIFKFYVDIASQRKLLSCIRKVCVKWSKLCYDPDLWLKIDGSLSNEDFEKFCKSGQMIKTQELIVSNIKHVRDVTSLTEMFKCLPNLRFIDFSKMERLTQNWMICLGKHCVNLKEVKMSKKLRVPKYAVSDRLMETFLTLRGGNLIVLDLSFSTILSMKKLLLLIANFCNNLEQLLIQHVVCSAKAAFPLEAIQKGCTKLQVLRLGSPIYIIEKSPKDILGFPFLKIFTHFSSFDTFFSDREMMNVLSKSPDLTVLDVRGCVKLTVNGILSLPTTRLEDLYIGSTTLHSSERLSEVLLRWSESLRVIDLSKMKSRFLDHILINAVAMRGLPNLESLDMNNSNVSVSTILKILENCEKLEYLDLSSCRDMGRGRMQKHFGKRALKRLFEGLSNVQD